MKTIKKSLFVLVGLVFLFCTFYSSNTYSENLTANVSVNPVFSFNVFPTSLDFTSADPGTTTGIKELTLWCSSNNNSAWSLQLSNLAELTSATFTIPNDNFNWWGWSEGSGAWHEGTTNLSTTPFTFYDCGLNEYITVNSVVIHLSFNVDIPGNQAAGSYSSTLVLTMTE